MVAFQTSTDGKINILTVTGRLEPLNGKDLKDTMNVLTETKEHPDLLVDLEKLEYMASAGFRELFFAGKKLSRKGGKLVVCSLRGEVKRIFEIARFDAAYPVFEDRQSALAFLKSAKP